MLAQAVKDADQMVACVKAMELVPSSTFTASPLADRGGVFIDLSILLLIDT
jgi:hypothetical protein